MVDWEIKGINNYKEWEKAMLEGKYIVGFDYTETGVMMEDTFHYDKLRNMIEFYLGNNCKVIYNEKEKDILVIASIRKVQSILGCKRDDIKKLLKPMYNDHKNLYSFLKVVDNKTMLIENKDSGTINTLIEQIEKEFK